ncbi:serine/threonine-protein kinase PLK1-like [Artemia franciscana]|uniref:Serine/threonine-protein kinase PLK n=1 Tax=Artemia franciscana TaxID=6661 RepID=A0AA88IAX9_ARTSF|nr:hypothetical protein QYM36_005726 [Artemia franciscana]
MSSRSDRPEPETIPTIIVDPSTKKKYQRGKLLGKGGFARCFELTDMATNEILAGKIVPKSLLTKPHQRDKMTQEIQIHKALHHKYIVGFHGFFEDPNHVYIILELCRRRSLMELHKRRKAITEPETRYFLRQILIGVKYLHDNKIIHRDLKLGNLFLNDEMEIKIGDFGLATNVVGGERKKTLCGTPNYIAPEVLNKKGHSFEVDVWSIGCIMYTLLVGRPPFETQTLKETYAKIKKNEYHVPSRIGPLAKDLIMRMLQGDPTRRPTVHQVLTDDFMTLGYVPSRLPLSCLTMAPRFDTKLNSSIVAVRRPLGEINQKENLPQVSAAVVKPMPQKKSESPEALLLDLHTQLKDLIQSKNSKNAKANMDDAEDPESVPMVWISKWVDYSDKYGFGYQLCDDSIGVIFNDLTRLLLLSNGKDIHYIERDGTENYHSLTSFPASLDKKVKLLSYFRNYMNEHLLKAGALMAPREGDELSRIPSLQKWFRTSRAVVMHMTNGTFQINFFKDHTKIILCPLMSAVTYIDEHKSFRTYKLSSLKEFGCHVDLYDRLHYAFEKVDFLVNSRSGSCRLQQGKSD